MNVFVMIGAVLSLQQAEPTPSATPGHDYISVGAATMAGGFTVVTQEQGATLTTRRQHRYQVSGVSAGIRRDNPTWSIGLRGRLFNGNDKAGQAEVFHGFRNVLPSDSPFETSIGGMSAMLDLDWRHVGVSGGLVAGGRLSGVTDRSRTLRSPLPAAALRVGWLSRVYAEFSLHDHDPAPVPGPEGKVDIVFLDDSGIRYDIGFADPGPFVGLHVVRRGFELSPFLSGGAALGFNLSLCVAHRFSIR